MFHTIYRGEPTPTGYKLQYVMALFLNGEWFDPRFPEHQRDAAYDAARQLTLIARTKNAHAIYIVVSDTELA